MNNGTGYIPQMCIPTKTGQVVPVSAGDDGSIMAGFYRGPTRFVVSGNFVTDLYTMLQWVKDPTRLIPYGDGLTFPTFASNGEYDSTHPYSAGNYVTCFPAGYNQYCFAKDTPPYCTDSNPQGFIWQFGVVPIAQTDNGRLYWKWTKSGTTGNIELFKDAAMTTPNRVGYYNGLNGSMAQPLQGGLLTVYITTTSVPNSTSGTLTISDVNNTPMGGTCGGMVGNTIQLGQTPFWLTPGSWTNGTGVGFSYALAACVSLTYGGIGPWSAGNPLGWRIPNINELLTLFDYSASSAPYHVNPGGSTFSVPTGGSLISGTVPRFATTKVFALQLSGTTTNVPVIMSMQGGTPTSYLRPVRSLIYNG